MLTRAHRQEALSRAYIHAIAGRCGLICSFREFDYGIDVGLHSIIQRENRYVESGYTVSIQAKSSTNALVTTSHVLYDLDVKNYNDLRDPEFGDYRILVLLVLPAEENLWTEQDEEGLLLRSCAYWLSLRGFPVTLNRSTIQVAIPRANVFSVVALNQLMERVRKGDLL